jgi:serine/threonine protein kinase
MADPLTVVELENAVGSQLVMAELGVAPPLQIAGRYRVLRLLGRGARGVVCQARDLHLHREVAIKLYAALGPGRAAQEVALEAQALARLRHPNVVGVYDFGDTTLTFEHQPPLHVPCFFMTMEHIRGQSMRRWLSVCTPSFQQVLAAFHQAGAGLAHAHESGVVHRDFKPDNVVIADDGRVLVVDFGLAHRSATQPEAETKALMLWSGGVVGTPEYMPPEARHGRADARSDQYSFALSLYEALTGSLPAMSNLGVQLSFARMPEPVGRVIARALASEPWQRFANMSALLRELPTQWGETMRWSEPSMNIASQDAAVGANLAGSRGTWLASVGATIVVASVLGLGGWWVSRTPPPGDAWSWPADTARGFGLDVGAASNCPELALVGAWEFNTRIWWDFKLRSIGMRDYRLELRRGAGCQLIGSLSKPSANFRGDAPLELRSRDDGHIELRGAWHVEQDYTFTFTFHGDTVLGDFVTFQRFGRPAIKGPLQGARAGQQPPTIAARRDLPCRSQCRLLCAGAEATQHCELEQCADPSAFVRDCGPPSADFLAPANCDALLTELERGEWQAAREGPACTRVVPVLAGEWTLHERKHSGEIVRWQVELLEVPDCRLVGTAQSEAEKYDVRVDLDVDGQWLLTAPDAPERLTWAMYGWEFAVGLSAGSQPARIRGQRDSP